MGKGAVLSPIHEFDNLKEAYLEMNRRFLLYPDQMVDFMENTRAVKEDLIIKVKNPDATGIDLGQLGYKKGKWSHLLRTYMDMDKFNKFLVLSTKTKGVSLGFDFNRKETGNGSCMREVIITRCSRKKGWTKAKIIWRATEIQKRWAADLILVHRLLEAIPNANFQEVTFYIASAYQSGMYSIPLVEPLFNVDWDKIIPEEHPYWKILNYRRQKYYQPDSPRQKLSPAIIMQEVERCHREGIPLEPVTLEDCLLPGLQQEFSS